MMMGYFRAPRRKAAAAAEGESVRAALLVGGGGEEAAVPKGYFAVYVGAEARRFVVPTSYLRQPAFRGLMELAADEFGFAQEGGLRLPCREEDFQATVAALDARRRPASGGAIMSTMVKARSL
ncbi:auxin-induced protein 15A [Oryza sativa Japonica Group]|uniref:Os02g0143300 protein n=3 Tax=Oryza TaxID=4527 RepID=A0A0P0VER5_ORYSJ|nr:auxin-induced protein 15A [Oryza sativa Japonica Group]XP_052144921.1 auxin-induced protein 15A-like [Oryza glaberrima]KAF2943019.1 hypothetical protein DAI22_02g035300 [Oryza sativa Japonica Group]BAS76943.1 Os02g0143300 [Oryza sativa Japonica Group]